MENKHTLEEIRARLDKLPIGYISKKTINGKVRYYHQWKEDGKLKSKYLKEGEEIVLQEQINERKALQAEEKELKKATLSGASNTMLNLNTNAILGQNLLVFGEGAENLQKRDCYRYVTDYINSDASDRIAIIYGLRRTGKTTMIKQAILDLTPEQLDKSVYIKTTKDNTIKELNQDMKILSNAGYKYVFIDEVTLIKDFIDSASLFSDVYAAIGMKVILSGTDSLGFWCSKHGELYDRAKMIHTTHIPYGEHSRLLGITDIDEYIRYGGTLRVGEIDFDSKEINDEEASFRDDESTRRYIDTAICKNIQHSLACYEDGGYFRHLWSLYEARELTNAINRIIEDMNHRFVAGVIEREFKSNDLRLSARNLRFETDEEKKTDILEEIDESKVTKRLMEILDIRNKEELSVGITKEHIAEIKEYLTALDLIAQVPLETTVIDGEPVENIIFTQPGMRYCQAQALVHSLMKDKVFAQSSEITKNYVSNRILDEVKGRMLEDITLFEASKALGKRYEVFKLGFAAGEFDMVIYDNESNTCKIYEIKHSKEQVDLQYKHLIDEEKCRLTERRFGRITNKVVLYRGENTTVNGIEYRNVEDYLTMLYQQKNGIIQSVSQDIDESEEQGFSLNM